MKQLLSSESQVLERVASPLPIAGRRRGRAKTVCVMALRRRRRVCSKGWQGGAGWQGGDVRRTGRSLDSLSTVHRRMEERRRGRVIVVVMSVLSFSGSVLILALCLGDRGRNPPTLARSCSG